MRGNGVSGVCGKGAARKYPSKLILLDACARLSTVPFFHFLPYLFDFFCGLEESIPAVALVVCDNVHEDVQALQQGIKSMRVDSNRYGVGTFGRNLRSGGLRHPRA